jgi:tRNA threonylcarbamoyladenosine biosynthesis protein TsaB
MPSFRQLLDAHAPLLLLDAASARIQVGFFGGTDPRGAWAGSDEEAGIGLFRGLAQLAVELDTVRAFAFCEGPGSVLGIRTAAMALRTWGILRPRPVYAYGSLALVAQAQGRDDAVVIADARRDSWHRCAPGGRLERVPTADLTGRLLIPEGFRNWTPLPVGVERVSYDLADLLPRAADAALFRPVEAPDAFLHTEPQYASWTPQVHRAP